MNLEDKLAQWQEAGLIDAATGARIDAFEHARSKPVMLYALGGLGAITLGIGVVSVVAANWDAISKIQKLGLDLALGAALATALYLSASRANAWLSDVLAGIYYAFVLASIALLGQVYQLGAPTYQALVTWSLCTAPLMLLVRSRLLGFVWLAGLLATMGWSLDAVLEALDRHRALDSWFIANLAVSAVFALALLFLALARVPWFVRHRPYVSGTWTSTLWTLIALGGFGACFLWYVPVTSREHLSWAVPVCGVIVLALAALMPRFYPTLPTRARYAASTLLGATWLVLATGATFSHHETAAIGAVEQVALLGMSAYAVLALGQVRAFNVLTGLIALRVLVMYFEVFGSMLDTGLGMITGGGLTLLLAWVWKRKSPQLAARFAAHGGSDVA